MGAVAGAKGLVRIVLPHYQADDLADLLAWEHSGARCDETPFGELIERTRRYFNAEIVDFGDMVCSVPGNNSFHSQVYKACCEIPYGQTMSYSALGRSIGREDSGRTVATAMSKNRLPLVVPCHRVIYADGSMGGFSAAGGTECKQRLLAMESATLAKASK